jgi:hypothetical protein
LAAKSHTFEKKRIYFGRPLYLFKYQRWAPALFSRFRAFALASANSKQERESAKKKKREKSESAERERKKKRICAFSSPHSGNPVSEPKAAQEGESKGLE